MTDHVIFALGMSLGASVAFTVAEWRDRSHLARLERENAQLQAQRDSLQHLIKRAYEYVQSTAREQAIREVTGGRR